MRLRPPKQNLTRFLFRSPKQNPTRLLFRLHVRLQSSTRIFIDNSDLCVQQIQQPFRSLRTKRKLQAGQAPLSQVSQTWTAMRASRRDSILPLTFFVVPQSKKDSSAAKDSKTPSKHLTADMPSIKRCMFKILICCRTVGSHQRQCWGV